MTRPRWDLRLDREAAARTALVNPPSYETIVELTSLDMEVRCCHWQVCRAQHEFQRAVFCVRVSRPAFDWFFNSSKGYRAQYYRSEWDGLRANDFFMQSVTVDLLVSDAASTENVDRLRESLLSPSAVVWLAKANAGPRAKTCPSCREGWNARNASASPEIWNDRWEHIRSKTPWGSRAPYVDHLRIAGAFIDGRNNVLIPRDERERARQINATGWT